MATVNPAEKELYPFSTEDSKAIPLDVIRPLGMIKVAITALANTALTIPVGWKVVSFYSNVGCFVQFASATIPTPPVANTSYADTLFVPPNCLVMATVLEGVARVVSAEGVAGYLIAQNIQKWAGLALRRQAVKI